MKIMIMNNNNDNDKDIDCNNYDNNFSSYQQYSNCVSKSNNINDDVIKITIA